MYILILLCLDSTEQELQVDVNINTLAQIGVTQYTTEWMNEVDVAAKIVTVVQ